MSYLTLVPAFAWLFCSAVFYGIGEYFSKKWGIAPSLLLTMCVVMAYAACALCWLPVLLHKNSIALMGSMWLLFAMISTITVGVIIFHETLSSYQIVGVILAVAALVLLSVE